MHGIQCGEVEFQNCSSLVDAWYIPVHTGTYWYRRKPNSTLHWITLCPPSCAYKSLQNDWLGPSHSFLKHCSLLHSQTTQAWLATAKVPQYIPAHASTYRYILVCTFMYWYILVNASTYWYEVRSTGSCMHWYILVHTS